MKSNQFFESLGTEAREFTDKHPNWPYRTLWTIVRFLPLILCIAGLVTLSILNHTNYAEGPVLPLWIAFGVFLLGIGLSRFAQRWTTQARYPGPEEWYDQPALYTINGIGTRFVGVSGNEWIFYQFICFMWMPIIPIGCYAAYQSQEDIPMIGKARWNILEVVAIYMRWWGGLSAIMLTIVCISSL